MFTRFPTPFNLDVDDRTRQIKGELAGGAHEDRALVALFKTQRRISLKAKDVLFREGDAADNIYLLASGMLCLYRFMPNGRRLIARFIFPEEIAGLGFDSDYPFTAECIEPTTVYKLSRSQLAQLCAHSTALQNDVVHLLKKELRSHREDHLPLMHQTAEARVARLIRMLARRNANNRSSCERIDLPMTRGDIADFLGITIETVCRSFTKLKEDGLISSSTTDQILIRNLSALNSLADGNR